VLCVALVVVRTTGCVHPSDADHRNLVRTGAARIEVRNDRFDDGVADLIRGGTPVPLGVAPGLSRRTFRVEPALLGRPAAQSSGAADAAERSSAWPHRSTFRRPASRVGSCGPAIVSSSLSCA